MFARRCFSRRPSHGRLFPSGEISLHEPWCLLDRRSRRFCPFRPHITFLPLQTHHCAIRSLGATPVRMSKRPQQSNAFFRQGRISVAGRPAAAEQTYRKVIAAPPTHARRQGWRCGKLVGWLRRNSFAHNERGRIGR